MIGVVGLSHLGIVSSAALAAQGFSVVACDPRDDLIASLRQQKFPFFEPGLVELVAAQKDRLEYSADVQRMRSCSVVLFTLDVPTDDAGRSDVAALTTLVDKVMQDAPNSRTTYVLLSQVAPGFTRRLADHYRDVASNWLYQVETLVFGNAVDRALRPERFIIGCRDPQQPLPVDYVELLRAFGCPILPMRYESAELTKISINLFLTSSVCVTNTIAELCENIGADWTEIAPALKLDRRIGPYAYLQPGLGIAGGNLERDLATVTSLSRLHGTESGVIEAWRRNSQHRRDWALQVLHQEVLTHTPAATVGVWGLAYKADTTSTKNSPAVQLIDALPHLRLRAFDPQAAIEPRPSCVQVASPLEACQGAAALVIMTPWKQFAELDPHAIHDRLAGPVVIDPFGVLDGKRCRAAGLEHHRLGVSAERGKS